MKTKEELSALKKEFETVRRKLAELTDEELKQVTSGTNAAEFVLDRQGKNMEIHFYDNKPDQKFTPKFGSTILKEKR